MADEWQVLTEAIPELRAVAERAQPSPGPRVGIDVREREILHGLERGPFDAAVTALRELAMSDASACRRLTESFTNVGHRGFDVLACHGWTALDDPDAALDWLLGRSDWQAIGWRGSSGWVVRDLVLRHSGACSAERYARLESAILDFTSVWEDVPSAGYGRFVLLGALPQELRGDDAFVELLRLHVRFEGPAAPDGWEGDVAVTPRRSPADERRDLERAAEHFNPTDLSDPATW